MNIYLEQNIHGGKGLVVLQRALKFSAVLGIVSPNSPMVIRPRGVPSFSMSKNTYGAER